MKNKIKIAFVVGVLFITASCNQKKEKVITPKIQYDVTIQSPNSSYDWWIQNIPGPQREKLIETLLKGALSGKYPVYDYFYNPINPQKVAQILNDSIRKTVQDKNPPYELKDTVIVKRIGIKDIAKLRFLEKWDIDPANLEISKKVMGIAPVAKIQDVSGNTRWQPLFWVITDNAFLKELKKNQTENFDD
ncbi:MAG: hypothetical protein JXR65_01300 [Bacteroidales bacterium]|nr:hypothetical protein [Bacteroidales bacterium]